MAESQTTSQTDEPRLAIDFAVATLLLCVIAFFSRTALTPDGVAYFENAELIARGHVAEAIQGYWSPGYSLMLVPVAWIAGDNRDLFLTLAHVAQALLCVVALWLAVVVARKRVPPQARRAVFWGCAWVLLVWLTQQLLTPDLLLATLVLLFLARLPARTVNEQAVLGCVLGAGFLVKTSIWPWLAVALVIVALQTIRRRTFPSVCLAVAAMIASPYVITLSIRAGHPTLGSVGPLNARWYLGDVARRLPDGDRGPHALKKDVQLSGGEPLAFIDLRAESRTYMPWSDPERWARGVPVDARAPLSFTQATQSWKENGHALLFTVVPMIVALVTGLVLGGAVGPPARWAAYMIGQPVLAVGIAAAVVFALVHAENRLLAPAAILMLMGAWPCFPLERAGAAFSWSARLATTAAALAIATYLVPTAVRAALNNGDLDRLNGTLDGAMARDAHSDGIVAVGLGTPWMPSLWRRHLRVSVQIGAGSATRLRYFSPEDRLEILRTWFHGDAIGVGEVYLGRVNDEVVSAWAFRPW
jgi:hypothetical protein